MKEFFKKILDIPQDKYLLFILGMFLTAVIAIDIPKLAEWPAFAVSFLTVFVSMIILIIKGKVNWWNCLAICLGSLPIQILCWIA